MGTMNIWNTAGTNKASLSFNGSSDVSIDTNAIEATKLKTPRNINGVAFDGSANVDLPLIGYGQTWQDVTASRALGTTYTNSTGKPIMICVFAYGANPAQTLSLRVVINGVNTYIAVDNNSTNTGTPAGTTIIQSGATYKVDVVIGVSTTVSNGTLQAWSELR